jgi:hypothetical protein
MEQSWGGSRISWDKLGTRAVEDPFRYTYILACAATERMGRRAKIRNSRNGGLTKEVKKGERRS